MKKFFFLLGGVIIPLISTGFELATGIGSETLFDPFANWLMIPAVISVPAPRSDYLASRMYANAPRMNRPVLERSEFTEDLSARIVTQEVSETVVNTTEGTKVLLDNVVFVNNGAAVGNGIEAGTAVGNGTAEAPVDTIQGGTAALVASLGRVGTFTSREEPDPLTPKSSKQDSEQEQESPA
ncbi:hypothetical protein N9B73_11800 [Verrucomicrobiales bacterium]|jgi:hypothetical protein|nr:hypothetical protein [Verrucomicrobiales bacterium]